MGTKAKIVFVVVVFALFFFFSQVNTGEMGVLQNVNWRIRSQTKIWELGAIFSENRFMGGRRGD